MTKKNDKNDKNDKNEIKTQIFYLTKGNRIIASHFFPSSSYFERERENTEERFPPRQKPLKGEHKRGDEKNTNKRRTNTVLPKSFFFSFSFPPRGDDEYRSAFFVRRRLERKGIPINSNLEEDGIHFGETQQRRQPRARLGKKRQPEVPEVFFRRTLDVRVQVKAGRRRDVREETIEK